MASDSMRLYSENIRRDIVSVLELAEKLYLAEPAAFAYSIPGVESKKINGPYIMSHMFETIEIELIESLMSNFRHEIAEFAGTIPSQRINFLKRIFREENQFSMITKSNELGKLMFMTIALIVMNRAVTMLLLRDKHSSAFSPGASYRENATDMCEAMAEVNAMATSIKFPFDLYESNSFSFFDINDLAVEDREAG